MNIAGASWLSELVRMNLQVIQFKAVVENMWASRIRL